MTSVASHPSRAADRQHRLTPARPRRRAASRRPLRKRTTPRCNRVLARYVDWRGDPRELVVQAGFGGSVLVLDDDLATRRDRRLVAHLAPDEPAENAELASCCYLEQARRGRCRCRPLTAGDLLAVPFADELDDACALEPRADAFEVGEPARDGSGARYRLEPLDTGMSIPELRWCRPPGATAPALALSVRDVVAALESYEPIRTRTANAIRRHRDDDSVSVAALRAELTRVNESPIVLNRALREAVVATVERDALSMSEIAMRCARVKRDAAGNESGETSWLARRLGLLPEGGRETPTRWIHTDVLALIARDGLGVSPREVEVA